MTCGEAWRDHTVRRQRPFKKVNKVRIQITVDPGPVAELRKLRYNLSALASDAYRAKAMELALGQVFGTLERLSEG